MIAALIIVALFIAAALALAVFVAGHQSKSSEEIGNYDE